MSEHKLFFVLVARTTQGYNEIQLLKRSHIILDQEANLLHFFQVCLDLSRQ